MVWVLDVPAPVDAALVTVGAVVAGILSIFTEAIEWIRTDPKSFDRAIALELIMFTLTTITLGAFFQVVQRGYEKRLRKAEDLRKERILLPFRRMLVSRLESSHGRLFDALTKFDNWNVSWGRPRLRSIASDVAAVSADLSMALLSHLDVLQEDEQTAAGDYSHKIFALQNQLENMASHLSELDGARVQKLEGIIVEIDEALVRIANAFEPEYHDRLVDIRWSDDADAQSLEDKLFKPLDERIQKLATANAPKPAPSAPMIPADRPQPLRTAPDLPVAAE